MERISANPGNGRGHGRRMGIIGHERGIGGGMMVDSLQLAVERYKLDHPDEYKKSQAHGEYLMSQPYTLSVGSDASGLRAEAQKIRHTMDFYGLSESDLSDREKSVLLASSRADPPAPVDPSSAPHPVSASVAPHPVSVSASADPASVAPVPQPSRNPAEDRVKGHPGVQNSP